MPGDTRTRYTPEQRAEALTIYREEGLQAASDAVGVPARTVSTWVKAAGATTIAESKAIEAHEARRRTVEDRKLTLAEELMGEAHRLLGDIRSPISEERIVVLSGGATQMSTYETVVIDRDATPVEKKALATAAAIVIDKLLLLTGGATARLQVEHLNDEEKAIAGDILRLVKGPEERAS